MGAPDTVRPDPAADQVVDPGRMRAVLGRFTTGVTVVTYRRGDVTRGATVNAFTSVSLAPPLVLISLDRRSRSVEYLSEGPFVVNLLDEEQHALAMHFAGRPSPDPVPWVDADGPAPRLGGGVGHLVCHPWRQYDGGDHVLHVGHVDDLELRAGRPLLFFGGDFPRLEPEHGAQGWIGSLDDPAAATPCPTMPMAPTGATTTLTRSIR